MFLLHFFVGLFAINIAAQVFIMQILQQWTSLVFVVAVLAHQALHLLSCDFSVFHEDVFIAPDVLDREDVKKLLSFLFDGAHEDVSG